MFDLRRRNLMGIMVSMALVSGCAVASSTDDYKPSVGQHGKDVIWVPTPDELVEKMLQTAKVKPTDLVYDLGSGDGKIPIMAAKKFGARAVGIEYNPDMARLGQRNAQQAGVADKVKIIRGDIFVEDFSQATVVTLYLLPQLNLRLRPTILRMKPGTRVVSHSFDMDDWEPDERISAGGANGYYWVVPAQMQGDRVLKGLMDDPAARLKLTQRYQKVEGTVLVKGSSLPIANGRIDGERLSFEYRQGQSVKRVVARLAGDTLMVESVR